MSFLKKLFGGGASAPESPVEEYEGYRITLTPIAEGDSFRVCAVIEKDAEGGVRTHRMVRADTLSGRDAACEASLRKAKQVIDEQGDSIFAPR